ncbi:MAG: hypothetical protein WDW38_001704 [Sanguina aurantia]
MPNPLEFFIKEKPKSAAEVVSKTVAALQNVELAKRERKIERALEKVALNLGCIKQFLFGDDSREPTKESVMSLAQEACKTELLSLLVKHLQELEFEARKDAAQVFGAIVRIRDPENRSPGAAYVEQHYEIIEQLFQGYDDSTIALNCGSMLRDCLRDESLARKVLSGARFMHLFEEVEVSNFEVASDAFSTFKDLLTRHKPIVAAFLQEQYDKFFPAYLKLLQSTNYVTRRQSLKLLGELLLDRSNVKVMVRFVSGVQHLMQMMVLLKDPSRSIQFEAFHVFKVFVANPNKPQPIVDILTNNRDRLLKYLEDFHTEKDEDEQFKEEKALIIKEIIMLAPPTPPPAPAAPTTTTDQQQQQQQ